MPRTAFLILASSIALAGCNPATPAQEQIPGGNGADQSGDEEANGASVSQSNVPASAATGAPEEFADEFVPITLTGLECADNCYLEYTDSAGQAQSALCQADGCGAWIEAGALPAVLRNVSMRVKFGEGQQVDASGNVMREDFPAIVVIEGL